MGTYYIVEGHEDVKLPIAQRFVSLAAVFAISIMSLAGCGGAKNTPSPQAGDGAPASDKKTAKTLKIGVALSLTGASSKEGNLMREGYEFWRDKVNAAGGIKVGADVYNVQLVMHDDQSDTPTSVKLTEKLITEDKVNFIFGPWSSGITQATSAIAEKYRVVNFAVTANAPSIYTRNLKYLFGILPMADRFLDTVIDFALTQNPKPTSVAILTPDNLFGIANAEGAKAHAEQAGLKVSYEQYPATTNDLSSVLAKVKAANPDLVLDTGFFQDGTLLVKQLKDLQWKPKLLGISVAATLPDFQQTLGADAEHIFGAQWWTPNMPTKDDLFGTAKQYGDEIKAKYGHVPPYIQASASVTGYVLEKAIESAGSVEGEKVRQALTKIDLQTMFGQVKFDEAGRNISGTPIACQILNGQVVEVFPQQFAQAKGVYPLTK